MVCGMNDVYILLLSLLLQLDNSLLLERVAETRPAQQATMYSMMDQLMEDDFSMDFTDTLFTTLNQQGFQFPNPKEMCKKHATSKLKLMFVTSVLKITNSVQTVVDLTSCLRHLTSE